MYGLAPYKWMTLHWTIFQLYDANLYCTALHDIMLAKEGTQLFLLLHVSCVAEIVHSSEVKLGSAGVATFVLEQVPFFQGTYSSSEFPVAALQRPKFWCCIHVSWTRSALRHPPPAYTTMVGSNMAAGIYPTGRAVPYHTGYSGYTHSHSRDGQILDDWPLSQRIEVSCDTGYQYSNCGDRTPYHTSGFLAGYLGSGCQPYIQ